MKGDFSRDTFDKTRHFSRVLMQQGRVQVDADWNEQHEVLLHYLRTLVVDLIGPHAGPLAALGFGVIANPNVIGSLKDATDHFLTKERQIVLQNILHNPGFLIEPGRYYVDGLLCENEDYVGYSAQPDWWPTPEEEISKLSTGTDIFLVYLDVWEQHMTAVQDERIAEKALNGPDTATRTKVVWQVKVAHKTVEDQALPDTLTADGARQVLTDWIKKWNLTNRGLLRAKVQEVTGVAATNPCITAPDAGYRGAENQLYRVEIHTGSDMGTATFKWSRENGSVVASWLDTDGNDLMVDSARGFAQGQWVELIDETKELRREPGTLVKVSKVEADRIIIDPLTAKGPIARTAFARQPRIRRWDQQETERTKLSTTDQAIEITESDSTQPQAWIELEDGIVIQFQPAAASVSHTYRTGDYWLIPARVATGNVEWPQYDAQGKLVGPQVLPPHGVEHHFAPLALIRFAELGGPNVDDLRCTITLTRNCSST
jgi:hypothetical protein